MTGFSNFLKKKLGTEYIKKARSVKIGIAGCGGLGSNCAFNLVRSGLIEFKLVDFDCVESKNLSRQFFFHDQIGMPKAEALADNIRKISPELRLDIVNKRISRKNIKEIFRDCEIVIEALDQAQDKAMIAECLLSDGKFIVSASGIAGYGGSDRIKTHKVKHNLVIIGDLATDISDAPPLSPMVNIAAAKQADAVIEYIMERAKIRA
jgi:sulfur carrier protein ThiS adenylyltransferase